MNDPWKAFENRSTSSLGMYILKDQSHNLAGASSVRLPQDPRLLFPLFSRNLSAIQDREICCYSVSCKEKDNIGKWTSWRRNHSVDRPWTSLKMPHCFPPCRYHAAVAHPAFKVPEKLKEKPPQSQLWPQPPNGHGSLTAIPSTASVK